MHPFSIQNVQSGSTRDASIYMLLAWKPNWNIIRKILTQAISSKDSNASVLLKSLGLLVRCRYDKPKELKLAEKHVIAFDDHTKDHLYFPEYSIKKSRSSKGVRLEISKLNFGLVLGLYHN